METHNGKVIAGEYSEDVEMCDPTDLDEGTFRGADVVEIDYLTRRKSTKTIRGASPRDPGVTDPDDLEAVVFGTGSQYAYDVDGQRVTTSDRSRDNQAVLAEGKDVKEIRLIEYPENVPVEGAPQTNVEAVIYFRSKRNGNIKTKTVEVTSLEAAYEGPVDATSNNMLLISGTNRADGRSIEASTAWDRDLITKGSQDVDIGKVVRVEFPMGHQFIVDLKNLRDDRIDEAEEKLQEYAQKITAQYSENIEEDSVEVTHGGEIDE